MTRTDAPHMEVGDPVVGVTLDGIADGFNVIGVGVEEDAAYCREAGPGTTRG